MNYSISALIVCFSEAKSMQIALFVHVCLVEPYVIIALLHSIWDVLNNRICSIAFFLYRKAK